MIIDDLFSMQDTGYRDFSAALMPTVPKETVIGVRVPQLRAYAGRLFGTAEAEAFLKTLPHIYYEENNLHAFLIERIGDRKELMAEIDRFLPFVDNWATCDMFSPVLFKKEPPAVETIGRWLASGQTYTLRFGVNLLMKYYMKERFCPTYLDMVAAVTGEDYYIRMAVAWCFATALTFQYEAALPFIENNTLPVWTHNKAIGKAIESRCIPPAHKAYLRTLKIK